MKRTTTLFIFLWIGAFLLPLNVLAQKKLEKEEGIPEEKVPLKALNFLKNCCKDIEKDWFLEKNLEGHTIEAKFKLFKKMHSIEFDIQGNVEDIEILTDFEDLPEEVRDEMEEELKGEFSKYKIERVQIQYKGNMEELKEYLLGESINNLDVEIAYEIVLLGIVDRDVRRFEYLFDEEGELMEKVEVISRETDNLAY